VRVALQWLRGRVWPMFWAVAVDRQRLEQRPVTGVLGLGGTADVSPLRQQDI
jgi:hypothetical protein